MPNRVLRFPVVTPGKLGPMEVFAALPTREGHDATPDGLTVDRKGNIYVAHLGTGYVLVLNDKGRLIHTWSGGMYDVSNLVFGGRERNQLFVTRQRRPSEQDEGRVYRLDLAGIRDSW